MRRVLRAREEHMQRPRGSDGGWGQGGGLVREAEALRLAGACKEQGVMTDEPPRALLNFSEGTKVFYARKGQAQVCVQSSLCFGESRLGSSGSKAGRQVWRPQELFSR